MSYQIVSHPLWGMDYSRKQVEMSLEMRVVDFHYEKGMIRGKLTRAMYRKWQVHWLVRAKGSYGECETYCDLLLYGQLRRWFSRKEIMNHARVIFALENDGSLKLFAFTLGPITFILKLRDH